MKFFTACMTFFTACMKLRTLASGISIFDTDISHHKIHPIFSAVIVKHKDGHRRCS